MLDNIPSHFFPGSGEMVTLTRQFDWTTTPLGHYKTWPAALRITVNNLLNSRFPMFLLWGPQYIQFYNDAYRPSFGESGKHPQALGQPGQACWAEAWEILEPLLEQVRLKGEALWREDQPVPIHRNGRTETTYWTFSYSPVYDDQGEVVGVLSTCFETTDKVKGLEHLKEKADELAFAIEATELGTWDLNPATGRFTANDRLKDWFGIKPGEEIPLYVATNAIAAEDRQRVQQAIEQAMQISSGGRYEETYTIIHPQMGMPKIVLAKGKAQFDDGHHATRLNGTLQDITERALAEWEIKKANQELLQSFNDAPVAIATIDRDRLTFTMANRFYGELVGRDPATILDKPLLEALPELTGQGFDKLLEGVLTTGIQYEAKEVPVDIIRQGRLETIYVDLVYQAQYGGSEQPTGVLVVATDVTGQVQSRKKVEESEARFRTLIEEAPVATCLFVGRDMKVELANDVMLSYWGKDDSILGLPLSQGVPELVGQNFLDILDEVYTSGITFGEQGAPAQLLVNGKLDTYYFDYTYKPLRNIHGQVYAIMDMAVDVTAQAAARQQLEATEAELRNAIELAELATWEIDVPTQHIRYSERLQSWLGIKQATLQITDSPRIHLKDRERVGLAMKRAMEPGGADTFDEVYTIINEVTGQQRIIHTRGTVRFGPDGRAQTVVGTSRDVTLQQELETTLKQEVQLRTEELAALNENLTRSNEELSQYAYVASHDLQEPLRKIRVFSEMLAKLDEGTGRGKMYLSRISQSAERMTMLITDLLEFSSLSNNSPEKGSVDLNAVIREVEKDFELLIEEKRATITIGQLPSVRAIKIQMNQLFYNIVGNALKFSRQDPTPHIEVLCTMATAAELESYIKKPIPGVIYYKISIADNGIGFEREYADQIFEVFKRLHRKEVYAGSGVGLALCRRIVINHGGYMYATSAPGKGTTFYILLPSSAP
ncbi:PAS domain-containing sensor histidine kinase [Paraflavitalea pollutisoli]|uniref:PAS domain-containing sensor histidine kinase n=1 Tax=Paraflavitalea pollutisoli TaxID=3034143 RepID=UPI0023EB8786|nr:PAS domain-containing protein [Paraflavitalea sp. H1-2-19X]